ncbi:MAG: NACHT domain-containing protein [Burkholderiales bacterium]|nr:NACHT domain-containing protein [Burkholderiales bacterium]
MVTISDIDFSKLKSYDGKCTRSFEQLIYTIVKNNSEYSNLGRLTMIDGSGGDGGVEFYFELEDADIWGWQCKYFGDNARLNDSRKDQIRKSLKKAISTYSTKLKKYYIYLNTDLTPKEIKWTNIIKSKNMGLELNFYGKSDITVLLCKPEYYGIKNFFFGKLEFNPSWFQRIYDKYFMEMRCKYDQDIHTIDKYTQSIINCTLVNKEYINDLDELERELKEQESSIHIKIEEFNNTICYTVQNSSLKEMLIAKYKIFFEKSEFVYNKICEVKKMFQSFEINNIEKFNYEDLSEQIQAFLKELSNIISEQKSYEYDSHDIYRSMHDFVYKYHNFFENYFRFPIQEIHFFGEAGIGKTHLACDIVHNKIQNNLPAILIPGNKFNHANNIESSFRDLLSIQSEYSFNDVLEFLNMYGQILNVKIPIVIDGLNETILQNGFSTIWRDHLVSFANEFKSFQHLVLITTCRSSCIDRIWNDRTQLSHYNSVYLHGFNYDNIKEVVNKYFQKYNIDIGLINDNELCNRFDNPIFLKMFCEVNKDKIEINIANESLFETFEKYFMQVNEEIIYKHHNIFKPKELFVNESIVKIAEYLWDNNSREINQTKFYEIIDGTDSSNMSHSKAVRLLEYGLLFMYNCSTNNSVYIEFTYQVIAGYLVAKSLINLNQSEYFIDYKFLNKLFNHPLYEDILKALCLLLPKYKKITLHDLIRENLNDNNEEVVKDKSWIDQMFGASVHSLFQLPNDLVKNVDVELITTLFQREQNKKFIFANCIIYLSSIKSRFNAYFLSNILKTMELHERDMTWTEYVRINYYQIKNIVEQFITTLSVDRITNETLIKQMHLLAEFIQWLLASTNRDLRDLATQALYFYGRKFHNEFAELVCKSLEFNDPYIWERMLASLYGVVMAENNPTGSTSFQDTILPEVSKKLYQLMFRLNAPYSTTHILARDYARRIIEIGLIYHPYILTNDEILQIMPPYKHGGIREWGEFNYKEFYSVYSVGFMVEQKFSNGETITPDALTINNFPKMFDVLINMNIVYYIDIINDQIATYKLPKQFIKADCHKIAKYLTKVEEKLKKIGCYALCRKKSDPIKDDFEIYTIRGLMGYEGIERNYLEREKVLSRIYWRIFNLGWCADQDTKIQQHVSYCGRQRPKIERYGKKYSWIAFYELAGFRKDANLFDYSWDDFRMSDVDIDPSFPINPENKKFTKKHLLDDKCIQFYNSSSDGVFPELDEILQLTDLDSSDNQWICLDGFITQSDKALKKEICIFIRALLIKKHDYSRVLELLEAKNLNIDHLSDIRKNYYSFAGELYSWQDATRNNNISHEFVIRNKDTGEIESKEDFDILLPSMGYNWETHHSSINATDYPVVVSNEIATDLKLYDKPQTFDLYDQDNNLASKCFIYSKNFDNNEKAIYLRKDLLNKFLINNDYMFVWTIWGNIDVDVNTRMHSLIDQRKFFQNIKKYDD